MVDFKKLMDPALQEKARQERAEQAQAQEEKSKRISEQMRLADQAYDGLSQRDQEFVRSMRRLRSRWLEPSEKQLKWLADIAARYQAPVAPVNGEPRATEANRVPAPRPSRPSGVRVGVGYGMRGYYVQTYDDDGPIDTGFESYVAYEDAHRDAVEMAAAQGLPCDPLPSKRS